MHPAPVVLAMLLATSAGGDGAYNASTTARQSAWFTRQIHAAEIIEARLRPRVGFMGDASQAPVRIVITNPQGGTREVSIVAFRVGPAQWREERVEVDAGEGDYVRGVASGAGGSVPPGAAVRLEMLLRNPALYREPTTTAEPCARAGQVVVSAAFEGARHQAVLTPCLPGLTGEAVRILEGEPVGAP